MNKVPQFIVENNDVHDELKKLTRRMESLEVSLATFSSDRNLLEDILARVSAVEQALHLNREHQTDVQKDIKADIKLVQHVTEDMKESLDNKTLVVTATNKNFFEKLKKLMKGGEKK